MSDETERAREAALRHLERKRRTRRELEERLRRAGIAAGAAREALDRLAAVGLVDDLEYARAYLRERLGRRPVGERLLRQGLVSRGVGREHADQALEELRSPAGSPEAGGEGARARRAAAELARKYAKLDAGERRRRLLAALARRGFDFDTAREAIEELSRV